jgi:hypothetical protein
LVSRYDCIFSGGAAAAGGSKAAFAMFQQKDVAAGGTGKASRYSSII